MAVTRPRWPDQMPHDGGVVAAARADMDNVLALPRRRAGEQVGAQRRLAIVDVAFWCNADDVVGVEINRVGSRRPEITSLEVRKRPRPDWQGGGLTAQPRGAP